MVQDFYLDLDLEEEMDKKVVGGKVGNTRAKGEGGGGGVMMLVIIDNRNGIV